MSIKSLFENIADAIKDKNPNITNVTPVEMPSAIRSIPSGSSTAGGVTYDNTTSRLTANNVQDAIDELAEDISTINSDLSELESVDSYQLALDPEKWVSDKIIFQKSGNVVTVTLVNNIKNYTVNTYTILGTLPEKFRPRINEASFVYNINDGATTAYQLSVDPDGRVGHYGYGTQGTVINAGRSVLTYICNS